MHLTVFNGSPKLADNNNTQVLVDAFSQGFQLEEGNTSAVYKLNKFAQIDEAVALYKSAEMILVAFPLYSFAMPAGVKAFIEALALNLEGEKDLGDGTGPRKKLGFLVQYGFKEAIHARPLEAYLIQVAEELHCDYIGTVIKGGCDSLAKLANSGVNSKVISGAKDLGYGLAKMGKLDEGALKQYAYPEIQRKGNRWVTKIAVTLINQYYWKTELKKNGAVKNSFDKPYGV